MYDILLILTISFKTLALYNEFSRKTIRICIYINRENTVKQAPCHMNANMEYEFVGKTMTHRNDIRIHVMTTSMVDMVLVVQQKLL